MASPPTSLSDAKISYEYTQGLFRQSHWQDFANFKKLKSMCCLRAFEKSPASAVFRFAYLSKGAANVIFQIKSEPFTAVPFCFIDAWYDEERNVFDSQVAKVVDSVLRVSRGRPKHLTCDQIMDGFHNDVRPLFEAGDIQITNVIELEGLATRRFPLMVEIPHDLTRFLMVQTPVLLYPGVLDHLASLTEPGTLEEHTNPKSFPDRHMGILLPDMSPVPGSSITLEIKPKWLRSSPNAPSGAIRCRTCAMQVLMPKDRSKYICPLALVSGDDKSLYIWAEKMVEQELDGQLKDFSDEGRELFIAALGDRVVEYLTAGDGFTLLTHLRWLDSVLDSEGILAYESHPMKELYGRNLRLAMTLRDCSLFIKIPYTAADNPHVPIIAKLGDLDFKSAEKFDDWKEKEEKLLAEDLYNVDTGNSPPCYLYKPPMKIYLPGSNKASWRKFVSD
ncbi:hypothetical protein IQ07DRAFT_287560 [Pyrenochaeta sp. DS3sAY3a]|nr:hypothetical protein IQ07DRAFT_287560 [Pyrenochaeta sp. DS3sAY3a]